MNQRYKLWLKQAKYDLAMANLAGDNKFYEWTCFCSEQSAEKSLKAFLIFKGWRIPHLHRISVLFKMCKQADPSFGKHRLQFKSLEELTFISRYPYAVPEEKDSPHTFVKKKDAKLCLSEAERIFKKIDELIE